MDHRRDTLEKHAGMLALSIELKLTRNKLTHKKRNHLEQLRRESKWVYNDFVKQYEEEHKKFNEIVIPGKTVEVLNPITGKMETRELKHISSQTKQALLKDFITGVKAKTTNEKRGHQIAGPMKYKSTNKFHHVPLKQYRKRDENGKLGNGSFYYDKDYNYIHLPKYDAGFKIFGGEQLRELIREYGEENVDFANANLVYRAGHVYIKQIVYVPKNHVKPVHNNVVGLDFGTKEQVVDSDGVVSIWDVPETDRLKKAQAANSRYNDNHKKKYGFRKGSRKQRKIIEKEYFKMDCRKDDLARKFIHGLHDDYDIIVYQDDNLSEWYKELSSESTSALHHSILGRLKRILSQDEYAIAVDRFEPTTRVCSACGYDLGEALPTDVREWVCPNCGTHHHRDMNASLVMIENVSDILGTYYEYVLKYDSSGGISVHDFLEKHYNAAGSPNYPVMGDNRHQEHASLPVKIDTIETIRRESKRGTNLPEAQQL